MNDNRFGFDEGDTKPMQPLDEDMYLSPEDPDQTQPVTAINEIIDISELSEIEERFFQWLERLNGIGKAIPSPRFMLEKFKEYLKLNDPNLTRKNKEIAEALVGFYLGFYIMAYSEAKKKASDLFSNGFDSFMFANFINDTIEEIRIESRDRQSDPTKEMVMTMGDLFFNRFFSAVDHSDIYAGLDINPLDSEAFELIQNASKMLSFSNRKRI